MQLLLKILIGMPNNADPDQTARSSLIWVSTVCLCRFIRQFGVQNFRIFTIFTVHRGHVVSFPVPGLT